MNRLAARDAVHEVYRYDAGHGSLVVEERIKQVRLELDFALRHLGQAAGRGPGEGHQVGEDDGVRAG